MADRLLKLKHNSGLTEITVFPHISGQRGGLCHIYHVESDVAQHEWLHLRLNPMPKYRHALNEFYMPYFIQSASLNFLVLGRFISAVLAPTDWLLFVLLLS